MSSSHSGLIVALDIGTSKVEAAIGEAKGNGALQLLGRGKAVIDGLEGGVVIDIEATAHSVRQALREAEAQAGQKATRVIAGVTGNHLRVFTSSSVVALSGREVTPADVARGMRIAQAIALPADQRLLMVEPQGFLIDGQHGRNPVGMSGASLETRVHVVTGGNGPIENLCKSIRLGGVEVEHLALNSVATSLAVLSDDERKMGVAVVDVGAGTTDVTIFSDGMLRHAASISIGGNQLTGDIAKALRTARTEAESLKRASGCAVQALADADKLLDVRHLVGHEKFVVSQRAMSAVIEPRLEEIFTLVQQVIRESGFEEAITAGVVIAGGCSAMPGMVELAQDVIQKPVRLGMPMSDRPGFETFTGAGDATVAGLLEQGRRIRARPLAVPAKPASNSWLQTFMRRAHP